MKEQQENKQVQQQQLLLPPPPPLLLLLQTNTNMNSTKELCYTYYALILLKLKKKVYC